MSIEFDSFTSESATSSRPSRRRAAGAVGATMLVAAAGGIGFGIGQAAGDADVAVSPADTPATLAPATAPPTPTAESTVGDGGDASDELMEEDSALDATASSVPVGVDSVVASGGGGWTMFGGEAMTLLTERTTESGIELRAHLGQVWDQEEFGYYGTDEFGGWQPPAWCFESGQVRVALGGGESTGTNVIDVGSVSWWIEPFNGRAVSALTMGTADGNPHRVVFVQAPPFVTEVSVVFGDGATDATVPDNGFAVLAVPGADPSFASEPGWVQPPTDFEVTFAEPEPDAVVTVAGDRAGYNDPGYQASCSPPPPALPEPGEQPAEPATDERTIIELMTSIYLDDDLETGDPGDENDSTDQSDDERFDDPTGIAEAREEVRSGSFEEAASNAEAIVEELVFTSPTEAWFRYRIETTTGTFAGRYGIAVLIDGMWKITRETICQDLALAGGNCGGYIENIFPPGS